MIESFLQIYRNNLFLAIIGTVVLLFIISRFIKTAHIYLNAKSYVKKSKRLRKKKYNGNLLVEKIQNKRKKNTNSFHKLKRRGKNLVRKYFEYKLEELPVIRKYSYSKLIKRTNDKIVIVVKNEKKTILKFRLKNNIKKFIEITDKYDCLDDLILFLHNLPEALLEQQDYDIYLSDQDITIGYDI